MIASFVHEALPGRVIFGPGSVSRVEEELDRLSAVRAIVLCTPRQHVLAQSTKARLGLRGVGIFNQARLHVPREVANAASAYAFEVHADCAIAVGGGSTIGLAKAMALESGIPIIAIPTTYAGSEMTPIYGITDAGIKRTGTDFKVLPKTVIYDPALTVDVPVGVSVTSIFNAIAHAAEGLYSRDANPVASLMAEEGIRAMTEALPLIAIDGRNLQARSKALYAAWLCGSVLGQVGMALHHKLCHTLGGTFNLAHSPTHTVVLPHALAYNYTHAPLAMQRIAQAMQCEHAPSALFMLAKTHGAPTSLRVLGLSEADVERTADIALSQPYWNPRPLERHAVRQLLERAFEGLPPAH